MENGVRGAQCNLVDLLLLYVAMHPMALVLYRV